MLWQLGRSAIVLALLCQPATSTAQGTLFPGGFEVGYVRGRAFQPDTSGWGGGLSVRVVFEPKPELSVGLEVHGWRQRIPERGVAGDSADVQRGDIVAQVRWLLRRARCREPGRCALEVTFAPFLAIGYGVRDDSGGPALGLGVEFDLRLGYEPLHPYGLRVGLAMYEQGHRDPSGLMPFALLTIGAAFRFSERR